MTLGEGFEACVTSHVRQLLLVLFSRLSGRRQSLAAAQQWGIVQPVQLTVDFCITAVVRTGMCRVEAVLW